MTCVMTKAAYGTDDDSVSVVTNDEMMDCIALRISEGLVGDLGILITQTGPTLLTVTAD